jgi:dihydropteroate synthase
VVPGIPFPKGKKIRKPGKKLVSRHRVIQNNPAERSPRRVDQAREIKEEERDLILRKRRLELGKRTLIMGILNVTPDSFYDGGRYSESIPALQRADDLAEEGADIIDVGGESTRPGAEAVPADQEWRRIAPVIEHLVEENRVVSVDTYKAEVARRALEAGAHLINDISGGTMDDELHRVAARYGAGLVVMHIQGTPRTMQKNPSYNNLMGEIAGFLRRQTETARAAGVSPRSLIIDPGIGFGKSPGDNLEIIGRLSLLKSLGYPIMVGPSRKSFIGHLTGLSPDERLEGSLGAAAASAIYGADIVRVHDVGETARLMAVLDPIRAHHHLKA